MNIKEAVEYRRRNPRKVPTDSVIASPEPLELNRIFFHLGFRWRIVRELTREEFQMRHMNNLAHHDYVGGNVECGANKFEPSDNQSMFPDSGQRYFYSLELMR